MLPYFHFTSVPLGPLTIQVWGLFVSLGMLAGIWISYKLAKRYSLSGTIVLDMSAYALFAGLIGARLFHVIFYEPQYYLQYPLEIFKFWNGGASSLGGFVGAGLAIWWFFCFRKIVLKEVIKYLDICAPGFWLGWGIGRIGCFMIHDHPGRLSNFFLAVNFPGGARFDLGLLESLSSLALGALLLLFLARLSKMRGGYTTFFSIAIYAIFRFFLDFLRSTDLPGSDDRYLYLTPAQWGMLAVIGTLTFLAVKYKIRAFGRFAYPPKADPPRAG